MRRLIFCVLFVLLVIPVWAQRSPEGTVEDFLRAWNELDYNAMYGYTHPRSQELAPYPVFENRYQTATTTIGLTGVSFSIRNARIQGETAVVTYDVTLQSDVFGTIQDNGRVMRLMNTPNGWRIAWSTLDIFDTFVGDAQLRAQQRQRQRANLYDRNGQVLASDGNTLTALYSSQNSMNTIDDCKTLLYTVTRQSIININQQFANRTTDNVFFLGEMPTIEYNLYSDQLRDVCGVTDSLVFTSERPHRMYYGGNMTAHVTGYVGPIPAEQLDSYIAQGYNAGDLVGLEGIERVYEEQLSGQPESVLRIVEPGGEVLREIASTAGRPSVPLTLTLDRDLQAYTVQAISDAFNYAVTNWGGPGISPGGAAVVLDVNTGAILALASYPLINPNVFNPDAPIPDRGVALQQLISDPREPLRNRAISEQFSPGSTYKIITAAAVLNEGLIAPDETFFCDLYWQGQAFGDTLQERSDWRVMETDPPLGAAGEISPAEAIMASCNPFFWQYGARLYNEVDEAALVTYSRRMGLGEPYGLNMGFVEAPGSLAVPTATDAAISESVGQLNIALPPIQMAVVAMAVANGGTVYEPYVVQQIGGRDGTPATFTAEPTIRNTLDFNPGVIETLQEGMCGVTTNEEFGTAYLRFSNPDFHVPAEYTVCGKTGTAQTARYANAWFIAYAPKEDPQIAIAVLVEQSLEGSQVAAPIVRRILDQYFGQTNQAAFPEWWNTDTFIPLPIPEGGGAG